VREYHRAYRGEGAVIGKDMKKILKQYKSHCRVPKNYLKNKPALLLYILQYSKTL